MLFTFATHVGLTNMQLENLLALIKAAPPTPRKKPISVERVLSMGLLTQMQQAHLSQGKSDGHGPIRMGELVKRGLPVNANKSFEKRLLSPEAGRRDRTAYGNHRFNAWAKESPNATSAEQKTARSVFASMWGDLPWEERLRFKAMQAVSAADLATDETESAAISPCGTLWQDAIGTDSVPLDDRHMENFLCRACGSVPNTSPGDGFGVNRGGVRNRCQPITDQACSERIAGRPWRRPQCTGNVWHS